MTDLINNKKKKKDSNRVVKLDRLIPDYNIFNISPFISLSVEPNSYCAGMAEWSSRSVDTRCPSGFVGSIPTPSAEYSNFLKDPNKKGEVAG